MQDVLKRSRIIGSKNGIIHFIKLISSQKKIKKEDVISEFYVHHEFELNTEVCIEFFIYMDILKNEKNVLYLCNPNETLDKLNLRMVNLICISKLLDDDIINIQNCHYDISNEKYFLDNFAFPLYAAVFKNFLINTDVLKFDKDNKLFINNDYENIFIITNKKNKKTKTIEELVKDIEQKQKQGDEGELFVIGYEQKRINDPKLSSIIKRISEIDVSAGYDIISFNNLDSQKYDRFIEVKTFKGEPHFYWSKNEIEKSDELLDKYYIYLVDYNMINKPNYAPIIINNPSKTIKQSDNWLLIPENYLVKEINKDDM